MTFTESDREAARRAADGEEAVSPWLTLYVCTIGAVFIAAVILGLLS